jgi:hypothetical protein
MIPASSDPVGEDPPGEAAPIGRMHDIAIRCGPGGSVYCVEARFTGRVAGSKRHTPTTVSRLHPASSPPAAPPSSYIPSRMSWRLGPRRDRTGTRKANYLAEKLVLNAHPEQVQQRVIDESRSTLCAGNYVDGNWTHTGPACGDRVHHDDGHSTLGLSHREGGPVVNLTAPAK